MASTKPEKSNPVSMNRATNTLSPCLGLLIEIQVSEVTTHNSAVTALNGTDLEKRRMKECHRFAISRLI